MPGMAAMVTVPLTGPPAVAAPPQPAAITTASPAAAPKRRLARRRPTLRAGPPAPTGSCLMTLLAPFEDYGSLVSGDLSSEPEDGPMRQTVPYYCQEARQT